MMTGPDRIAEAVEANGAASTLTTPSPSPTPSAAARLALLQLHLLSTLPTLAALRMRQLFQADPILARATRLAGPIAATVDAPGALRPDCDAPAPVCAAATVANDNALSSSTQLALDSVTASRPVMDAGGKFPELAKNTLPLAPTSCALAAPFGETVSTLSTVSTAAARDSSTGLLATAFATCARTQPLGLSTGFWGILFGTYITSTTPAEAVNLYDYSGLTTVREALVVATASGWWGPHYGSVFQPGPLLEWHQSLVDVPLLFLITYATLAVVVAWIERAWTRITVSSPPSWSTVHSQLVSLFSRVATLGPISPRLKIAPVAAAATTASATTAGGLFRSFLPHGLSLPFVRREWTRLLPPIVGQNGWLRKMRPISFLTKAP